MTDETEDDKPLSEADHWRVTFVGLHLRFMRLLFELLIDKGVIESEEAWDLMHRFAEEMRTGADAAGVEDPAYHLATQIEKTAEFLARRKK